MLSKEEQWYEVMRCETVAPSNSLMYATRNKVKGNQVSACESEEESLVAVVLGINALVVIIIGMFVMCRWILPSYRLIFLMILTGLVYLPCLMYILAKDSATHTQIGRSM
jgi:hypothetical protein